MRYRQVIFGLLGPALTFWVTLGLAAQEPPKIDWASGPITGVLLDQAEVKLPEGFLFTGVAGTKTFLELTRNFPSGREAGMFMPAPEEGKANRDWFVIFEYHDSGYVKDEEKNSIDSGKLLKALQEGTEQGNEERKKRGWPTLQVVSWSKAPFYDPKTNNLTWGTLLRNSDGSESINYTTRMLGRHGYMQVDLVTSPEEFPSAVVDFERVMADFGYIQGRKYAEFKSGDKVAAIGLTALVAGGAGVALAKSGLLGKLSKLVIPILIAIGAFFKTIWGKLSGKKAEG